MYLLWQEACVTRPFLSVSDDSILLALVTTFRLYIGRESGSEASFKRTAE